MLCACSGEQFKFEEALPQSPESLATRDFSVSGLSSSRTGDWESKAEDVQVDEAESTLKEALSLNYEEARALLGRLEFQRGNFDAALQVFQGIDIRGLTSRMIKAISERTRPRKLRSKGDIVPPGVMSLHSVSLLLEAILLKAKSLEELGHCREAAKECTIIIDVVESALPNGMPGGIVQDCKLQEIFHKALDLLPYLWIRACLLNEAISAYRRALVKQWNLDPQRLASVQKDLAALLLYGGVEASFPRHLQGWGPNIPKSNTEEAILLLLVLMEKVAYAEIKWDEEIMNHLTYALSISGQFELLADLVEQALPAIYRRAERWYLLALCYSAASQNEVALNLLKKVSGSSEAKHKVHIPSLLLGAKLYAQDPNHAHQGIIFARKVIDATNCQHRHFAGSAHKFLGVCYGNAARMTILDSERVFFQNESLNMLNHAALNSKEDPEVMFSLALENALQRNLEVAFDNALMYSRSMSGNSERGWKLLALVLSAEQRYKDADNITEFALEEVGRMDQLELLRLKAVLQIAQEQPKQAMETYKILLTQIHAERDFQAKNSHQAAMFECEALAERNLELAAWQDLATIYIKLGIFPEAEICVHKAKLMEFFSARSWHTAGLLFEAQSLHKEALVSLSVSLSIEPDYVPSIVSTAEVLMKLGSQTFPIARSFLMNALRLEPTNHEAWMNLGLIAKTEGLLDQAAEFFQAAYELKQSAPVQNFV
ncbi:tetratricopeptide repeat protein 7A [Tripterygium wilfordii]|uniref:Tetratricopeptide repeat protein 7A n=1 Tax=Tripterygium wilfordii TaxID=458696 RepID=A0A7J7D2R7_TRIWF|nr:protein NPGR1 [Tripterygium wilfordii]XP_038714877.1 protein NPGR1 [Tripterygium wilfordii]KAF5740613.1 tetratricopeptide repeat protein 7A [Tripterygium wilfordii]